MSLCHLETNRELTQAGLSHPKASLSRIPFPDYVCRPTDALMQTFFNASRHIRHNIVIVVLLPNTFASKTHPAICVDSMLVGCEASTKRVIAGCLVGLSASCIVTKHVSRFTAFPHSPLLATNNELYSSFTTQQPNATEVFCVLHGART